MEQFSVIKRSKVTQNGLNETEENDQLNGHKKVIIAVSVIVTNTKSNWLC